MKKGSVKKVASEKAAVASRPLVLIGLVVIIALVEWLVVNHTHKRRRLIEKRVSAMR